MFNTLEKFDEAITDCDKAIEINPNFVKVRWFCGIIIYRLTSARHKL